MVSPENVINVAEMFGLTVYAMHAQIGLPAHSFSLILVAVYSIFA